MPPRVIWLLNKNPCPTMIRGFVPNFIIAHNAMFSLYPWESCSLLKGNRGRVDPGEWQGERKGGREIVVWMSCMREE